MAQRMTQRNQRVRSTTTSANRDTDDIAIHPRLSPVLTSEMSRLYSAGFSLIPLGGDDGKKPIIGYKTASGILSDWYRIKWPPRVAIPMAFALAG
jgi:hypothetical protein